MIKIETIRESNAKARPLNGQVGVFVGGTGGIGESTAKEFFLRTTSPKAYIIGRNMENGNRIVQELKRINPRGLPIFLQKDISLFKNVDDICAELKERESKINCLFLTAGYMSLKGRTETADGIDRKMCVNYYARIRWILNLMPLLTTASEMHELSRVITVLAAGSEGDVRVDDLDLKHNFTLHACLAHCVVMTDFAVEELARRFPGTSFSHSYPGTVKSGIANELTGPIRLAVKVMYAVMTPWILDVQESGERHFFQMTSRCYPPANGSCTSGVPVPEGLDVMRAMSGQQGGGAYLLDWDGKPAGDEEVLGKYRDMDMATVVWNHTIATFKQAEDRQQRDLKRLAESEPEGSGRPAPEDPIGWRPG